MQRLLWRQIVARDEAFHFAQAQMKGRCPCRIHTHDFPEVFFVKTGQGLHLVNSQRLPLVPGSLVLIRAADVHGFRATDPDGFTLVNVAFRQSTLAWLHRRYFPREKGLFWSRHPLPVQVVLDAPRRARATEWFGSLANAPRHLLEIERFLLNLLPELSVQETTPPVSLLPDWLAHALEAVRQPQHFRHGTRGLARLAARSPEHVNRLLRQHLGITATDLVNRARLDFAARQLATTDEKILDVALSCGCENLGHFYELFRQQFGVTPRVYRLRHRVTIR